MAGRHRLALRSGAGGGSRLAACADAARQACARVRQLQPRVSASEQGQGCPVSRRAEVAGREFHCGAKHSLRHGRFVDAGALVAACCSCRGVVALPMYGSLSRHPGRMTLPLCGTPRLSRNPGCSYEKEADRPVGIGPLFVYRAGGYLWSRAFTLSVARLSSSSGQQSVMRM